MKQLIVNSSEFIVNELRAMILCFLSGVILTLPFNNGKFWVFAWLGFAPLFFALEKKSKGKAFLLSYLTGVIFWLATIYWLIHVTLGGMILLILYLALYFGIFGIFISTINYELSTMNFLLIPSAWVLLEYIRSHLFTGFPWALLGYSQYLNLPVIQLADITGVWGVSFLVMMVNVAIWQLLKRSKVEGRRSKVRKKGLFLLPLLCIFFTLAYGHFRIHLPPSTFHLPPFKVSIIQGNIPQELKWDSHSNDFIMDKYFTLTFKAAGDNPDLIIWPEAAVPIVLEEKSALYDRLKRLAQEIKAPLLLGAVTSRDIFYFNSALLFSGEGKLLNRYDKLHLVPFGEYIPFKKILPFLETIVPIGDITAGKEYTVFRLPVTFSVLICFEDLFPELSRRFVKNGAQLLVNITNDAWYKRSAASYQHLQASVFRAVENRVFLVRSANTGVSGFISPEGEIISKVSDKFGRNIFIEGYDTQDIAIQKHSLSFYTRYGDIFVLACFLYFLYGIMLKFH